MYIQALLALLDSFIVKEYSQSDDRQLSYAMKNLLQAPKTPSNFVPFAVSSWHKDRKNL